MIVSWVTGSLNVTCGGTLTTSAGNSICTFKSSGNFTVNPATATFAPWQFNDF